MKKGHIFLKHNSFTGDVPIAVALKALGVQSDKDILLLCARNTDSYQGSFSPNFEEAAKLGISQRSKQENRTRVSRKVAGPRRPAWEEAWSH